ncbi:phosphonate transport system permease protein [Spiroplasma gladiatoris]|uniref:Phosphonate transport system permease protein n=1 Tax=Spiroplasma gladiatoris TaxID=2143 RepID=A0A4P7AHD3_9MOLU|nr:ABC transporter permease subunit [Spiroplasma gladiatoris]QBQ07864.1 phosphonate transport system permease protein [Spiroplasma gladiatoris]
MNYRRRMNALFSKDVFKIDNDYVQSPKKYFAILFFCLILGLLIFSIYFIDGDWKQLINGFPKLFLRIKQMLTWDLKSYFVKNTFGESFIYTTFVSFLQTFLMSFAGTVIGIIIALFLAICACNKLTKNKFINNLCIFILGMFRTIPSFVFVLILIGYFGQNTFTVMLTIVIFSIALSGKLFLERLQQINYKIYSTLIATGSKKPNAFNSGIKPQLSVSIMSLLFYGLESNVKYVAIIGGISRIGIGQLISKNQSLQKYDRVGFILFNLMLCIVFLEALIYFLKKYVIKDKDFFVDNKEIEKLNKQIKNINLKKNKSYFIESHIKNKYLELINENKNNKVKVKERKLAMQKEIKKFKNDHKYNLKKDINDFKEFKEKNININKWFVYNDYFKCKVRRDKIFVTNFNAQVQELKKNHINNLNLEIKQIKHNLQKNLSISNYLQKEPKKYIKRVIVGIIFLALFIYSMTLIDFHIEPFAIINSTNKNILRMLNMDLSSLFLTNNIVSIPVIKLVFETISIAMLATFIGSIFAYIFALLSSETIVNFYIAKVFKGFTILIRVVPTYIYAIIFVSIIGLGPFNGAIALAIGSFSMLTKYSREAFEEIDTKLVSQLEATGFNFLQKFRYGIIPQTSSRIISYIVYRFDINFKEVTILGVVGAGNMGFVLVAYFNDGYFEQFGALMFGIIICTFLVEYLANILRQKIKDDKNPYLIDWIILKLKNKNFILYKTNEVLLFNKDGLSFDRSKALYSYTNKKLFAIKKSNKINKKTALLKAYQEVFSLNKYSNLTDFKKEYLKVYKLIKLHFKNYLKTLKKNYTNNLKNYHLNYIKYAEDKTLKANQKDLKIEYKRSKIDQKTMYKYKVNNLNWFFNQNQQ